MALGIVGDPKMDRMQLCALQHDLSLSQQAYSWCYFSPLTGNQALCIKQCVQLPF